MRYLLAVLAFALATMVISGWAPAEEPGGAPRVAEPAAGPPRPPGPPARPLPPGPREGGRRGPVEPPPFMRGGEPAIFREVTDEQIENILAFVRKYMPWRVESLQKMRESEPERFRQLCRRLRFEVSQLLHLKERDEAAFQKAIEERRIRMRAAELAQRVRETENQQEREALVQELRGVINEMFELEIATQEAHIRGLEERIEQLRRELRERADHRREVVEQRLREAMEDRPEPREPGPPNRGQFREDRPGPPGPPAGPPRDEPPPIL